MTAKPAALGDRSPYSRPLAQAGVVRASGWHGWQPRLVGMLDRLATLGARPEDSRDERLRYGTLIFGSVLIAVLSVVWVVTYLALRAAVVGRHPGVLPAHDGGRAGCPHPDAPIRRLPD